MSLEKAIYDGDLASVRQALRDGAAVNRRGAQSFSPLMVAAGLGQSQMVELLLASGADPHMMDLRMGATALHKAAQSGNPDVIEMLITSGAFVDQQSPILGNTALIDAVLHKQEAAVRTLLSRGARTKIRNHWQQSALELARKDGDSSLVRAIEARDAADADEIAGLTLIAAVKAGDVAKASRCISAGVDLNQRLPITGSEDDGYTPLGLAVRGRQTEIVSLLLNAGADAQSTFGLMHGTAAHEAGFLGLSEILQTLLNHQSRIGRWSIALDAQGPYNGLTPLHDAIWHGHLEAVRVLIDAGAPLFLRTHAGLTPRELAEQYGYADVASTLAKAEEER